MVTVPSTPPLANYGILTGQLFLYARGRAAFESVAPLPPEAPATPTTTPPTPASLPSKKCILLGGLSDGLLPVPYTALLEQACHDHDWSLVQPVLSSSYLGFGTGSLDRDAKELGELMEYLVEHRNGQEFALVGHSTGCQDAVCLLEAQQPASAAANKLRLVALQAPVSDREGTELEEGFQDKLQTAQKLVADGQGAEMLPRSCHWAPMTAQRYVDLHARGGRDDYFSSDYTDAELQGRLEHVSDNQHHHPGLRVLVAFSGADQYVPAHVDKAKLTQRLVDAMNGRLLNDETTTVGRRSDVARALYIENGDHNLSDPADAKIFVDRVAELFREAATAASSEQEA